MSSTENKPNPITRRQMLKTGASAAVVAIVAGVGGYLAFTSSQPGPAPAPQRTQAATQAPATTQAPTSAPATQAPATTQRPTQAPATTQAPTQAPATTAPARPGKYIVEGATPAERALNGVKLLRAQGKIPPGTKLRFLLVAFAKNNVYPDPASKRVYPDGTVQKDVPFSLEEWTKETGIPVEFDLLNDLELYEKIISEGITKAGTWDFMSARIDFIYDYIGADAVLPLKKFEDLYGPELNTGPCPNYAVTDSPYRVGGELWGFTLCGDFFNHFVRQDLVEDRKEREGFEKQFGKKFPIDLNPDPVYKGVSTWDELIPLAQWFHRPDQNLNGAFLFRGPWFSNLEVYMRYFGLGNGFFDKNKNVTFNNSTYKRVLQDMKAIIPYQDPISLKDGWQPMYPDFSAGKVFQTISWGSLSLFGPLGPAGIKGFGIYEMPGYVVNGKNIKLSILFDNTSYIVNKWGKLTRQLPDIPFLFGQYLSDPDIGTKMLTNPGAISDPYRTCHSTDKRMINSFLIDWPPGPTSVNHKDINRRGTLETIDQNLKFAAPPVTISGLKEIQDTLGTQNNAYWTDIQDIDTTARNVQERMDSIVDRFGRDRVFEQWKTVVAGFPKELRDAHSNFQL